MGLGDLVQKAVYLGIGVASYAGEKAGGQLTALSEQMQKMADEMVERGEMTAEEARKFVDETVRKAQQAANPGQASNSTGSTAGTQPPRSIEITDEGENSPDRAATDGAVKLDPKPVSTNSADNNSGADIDVETMRQQVQELQDELRRLRKN